MKDKPLFWQQWSKRRPSKEGWYWIGLFWPRGWYKHCAGVLLPAKNMRSADDFMDGAVDEVQGLSLVQLSREDIANPDLTVIDEQTDCPNINQYAIWAGPVPEPEFTATMIAKHHL